MAQQGESAGYYQGGDNRDYQMQQPQQQQGYGYGAPQQQGGYGAPQHQQGGYGGPPPGPPPQQQQDHRYGGGMPPPPVYGQQYSADQKPQFDEAFKIEKPKWNDLWAGILFIIVCAGYVVVSAISIQGYAATKGFNGGGIYDSGNEFGLSTNTIVLFAFCLLVALVLGYGYVWLARSKQQSLRIRTLDIGILTMEQNSPSNSSGSPAFSTSSPASSRPSTCFPGSTGVVE